jgi:hypothetical protein
MTYGCGTDETWHSRLMLFPDTKDKAASGETCETRGNLAARGHRQTTSPAHRVCMGPVTDPIVHGGSMKTAFYVDGPEAPPLPGAAVAVAQAPAS